MDYDVIIIGAGAAGLMAAIEAGKRARKVLVLDHAKAPAEKIRISGGGRCNFTNIHAGPNNFISQNPHFCKSSLKRYSAQDFIALVRRHRIDFHEKTLGQLFCDHSAKDIIALLLTEMRAAKAELRLETSITRIEPISDGGFRIVTPDFAKTCTSLIIATGGKSIPKMGATGFGYEIARQFDIPLVETRPALVPLTFEGERLEAFQALAGVSLPARASHGKTRFDEALLFTHRGLSGPVILQISSFWREGDSVRLCLLPGVDIFEALKAQRQINGRQALSTALATLLPKRLAQAIGEEFQELKNLADYSDKRLRQVCARLQEWSVTPAGSEGYRTAEVTLGGVDTRALDSQTMMAKTVPGLYFIGEVVDVTGWLGGYNFQWAWSSGWVAGQSA
ncbi:BaiN/RdsA family NAD(P)/FAD-dependent oxidoreductase [Woodsholea maritima]|uniref:NAD(P)/FAD-dependent oxidoreductase n=1 Tax=Woodsholea maritima TaxID=240237 RepID=UPI000380D0BB|nr:NAD(P)/FAD-dependent oxidoreductase [Woodsholea maritima]